MSTHPPDAGVADSPGVRVGNVNSGPGSSVVVHRASTLLRNRNGGRCRRRAARTDCTTTGESEN